MRAAGIGAGGRYRLEAIVSEIEGSTLWRAKDEFLSRTVALRTLEPGFARTAQVIAAACAAGRLTDARIAQVYDADDSAAPARIITEWPQGIYLADLLAAGPLDVAHAIWLIGEAADALAAAHARGVAHCRLSPRSLILTSAGCVKIIGLATDAALCTVEWDDPAREDAQSLASLLYAAVTAHWPGTADSELPSAPRWQGRPVPPRLVVPGVPFEINAIVHRTLGGRASIVHPTHFAEALADLRRASPMPAPPPTRTSWAAQPGGRRLRPRVQRAYLVGSVLSAGAAIAGSILLAPYGSSVIQTPVMTSALWSSAAGPAASVPRSQLTPLSTASTLGRDRPLTWPTRWYADADLGGLKPGNALSPDTAIP